ncbi:transcription initiation factor IIA subunit 1 isoform X2 [Rhineura floridana]|uniref:transcription initiation factor IIA subunit 1 isoform X2 n=1 Tax=Rhineura floridana TaxID=261503 RepID=UPI002AC83BF1|nr:transcription initiation factor IIA subunit 1 isoform X2 [Rhineura floridana]
MASSANTNPVPKLYRSVMEDVINDVREVFLDEGVDEQVLVELKTLWENKLLQSKAVDGFHSEEQQLLLQVQQQQQQQQQQHTHHHHHPQPQPQPTVQQQSQAQQVLIPATQQAPQQQIMPDSKLIQHMNASGMSAPATTATLALPAGVTPVQQLLTNSGQLVQVVRTANGTQYIIHPQQQVVLQQQVIPQMQPGGVQSPVIQQVLAPIPGGISQQTGVIIQPQQILFTGNKTQVIPTTVAAPTTAQAHIPAAGQQPQQQTAQPQAPLVLQVDGAGDTSSEEEEEEEEDYDDDEEEDKEKDGGEDGQVEEEPLNSEDDVSDEEGQELFDTENVVVCQYDKIHRSKNKWKFHLKDGIMNLNGRDYVFSKAIGDAEW